MSNEELAPKSRTPSISETNNKHGAQIKKSSSQELQKLNETIKAKWKNWWIRSFFTIVMISGFYVIIICGPPAIILLVISLQVKCYHEIISVGNLHFKKYNLPWFRTLSWYFLGSTNYFFYGQLITEYFAEFMQKRDLFMFLLQHHRLISFLLYTTGIMLFVLSLRKNYYKVQFALFGWYQLTLLIILTPGHLITQNLMTGLIWFLLPVSLVICNDIMAYVFGFFFGKTQLIKLSPKKTWEGFIGGWFSTVVFGLVVSELMCNYQYFYCPPQFESSSLAATMDCSPSPMFQLSYQFTPHPSALQVFNSMPASFQDGLSNILAVLGMHLAANNTEVWMYPMMYHGIVLATFSSLIAPFGGFFASGFKRAFKIKDFSDTIPGHGGIMDRFDCQFLMGCFVNVYIASVVSAYNPNKLLKQVLFMEPRDQVQFYHKLRDMLHANGLINP
ncbi:phosphatidate cytidylyltransferase 1 [Hydra vulgaris]|uniref:phosphatidate cytidylyltransferase 1 n=1 Tax=Hydra vulgaris TaxID=6087 RepID=UPI0006417451|nr:phosphatidate cytidylyltransferase 1 [Hydra vulgaris]